MRKRKKIRNRSNRERSRDEIFPPRTETAREQGARMALRKKNPAIDWRAELAGRFGIDANRTPCELDGYNPGEPDRYDYADIQEAHALAHVPLWLIDESQVKLLFDYGYDTHSTFCLALLMLERDPFLDVDGSVVGELLPSVLKSINKSSHVDYIKAIQSLLDAADETLAEGLLNPEEAQRESRMINEARDALPRRANRRSW